MNGLVGEELELQRRFGGIAEFAQAIAAGLGGFIRGAKQCACDAEGVTAERVANFKEAIAEGDLAEFGLRVGDGLESTIGLGVGGIGSQPGTEGFFGGGLASHQDGIVEPCMAAVAGFAAVLVSEQLVLGAARVFLTAAAPGMEKHLKAFEAGQRVGELNIAKIFQLGHRHEAARTAGVAGDKCQLALGRAIPAPLEVVGDLDRLVVLVNSEQAKIEVETGILKIVGIASEEGDLLFGREGQADIGVTFESVEMVLSTLIQRHHVAAQACLVEGFFFDFRDDLPAGSEGVLGTHAGRHGGVHPGRHVGDGLENIEFQVHAFQLLGGGSRVESVAQVVLFLAAELLDRVGADMVVGNDEAVLGDE